MARHPTGGKSGPPFKTVWTVASVERLHGLFLLGHSESAIARRLGTTRDRVRYRLLLDGT